jgi:hypothetical protein
LTPEEGAHLLLQRAGMLAQATPEDHAQALALSRELGGLPLALDQAAAYMLKSRLSLAAYQQRYQQHHARLLNERHSREHPTPVATTWDISFRAVAASHPAAADLLRFCACLAPDAIPEELLTAGAAHLGPLLAPVAADPLELDAAIMALRAYSLIERDPQEQTLTVHRLVQAVMRESLPDDLQRTWRHRVLLALCEAFPAPEYANWPHCERLLPHAQMCAHWIEHTELLTNEAGYVLNQAGLYLVARGRYGEAEPLHKRALAICEQVLGAQHPDTATSLKNLARH